MNQWALTIVVLVALTACSPPQLPSQQPGAAPTAESTEGGMWMQMEQVEHQIMTTGLRVPGETEDYVRAIACRVAGDYCPDIRVYLLDIPEFNASMAPNGTMIVWTGLLLRVENEAQLASVLGHEVAHYERRHSLARWIETRNAVNALTIVQFAALFGGVANVSEISQLAAGGILAAHSRAQESEADDKGIRRIAEAGYDPREAPKIWQGLIEEREASDDPAPLPFFASHPASDKRAETLTGLAQFIYDTETTSDLGGDRFNKIILAQRGKLLRAELQQRRFERTQILLDRLIAAKQGQGELHYHQGELYRLRNEDGDDDKAIASYRQSLEYGDTPAEAHRSLGIALWSQEQDKEAQAAFKGYLDAAPDAEDAEMIRSYLEQL